MKLSKILKVYILLLLLLMNTSAFGAKKITVVFGEVLAPWVMADTNKGIVVDIFTEAIAPLGYEIEAVYMPYARRSTAFLKAGIDVVSDMNLKSIEGHNLAGYFSDVAYAYENFAFSLHKNQYKIKELSDLENYSLLSWQDAAIHLGDAYAEMARNNPRYSETFDQSNQVKMLYLERFQIIQMDAYIFAYYRAQVAAAGVIDTSQKVDRFALFGQSPNGFLFKSEALRDQFNQQLKWLKSTGQYQKIFERYID